MNRTRTLMILSLVGAVTLAAACKPSGASAESAEGEAAPAAAEAAPAAQEAVPAAEEAEEAAEEAAPVAEEAAPVAEEAEQADVPPVGSETPEQIFAAIPGEGDLWVTLVTTMGEIECDLHEDKAPNTVANFVGLATGNKTYLDQDNQPRRGRFYDGLIFHRVIPGFMIQGGDPTGTGRGGPGYRFADEFHPQLRHDRGGLLSMANAGPGTNGSQFFVTEVPTPHLDNRHAIFGECTSTDVVERIARVSVGPNNRPLQDVVIESVVVSRR
jgi:peptidyl-prolyl cis-trans isomerase A (cyclophilin A)